MRWIIILALATPFLFGCPALLSPPCQAQEDWGGPINALTPEERAELTKIVSQTALEGEVTPERHQRFWEIVDSHRWTKADIQEVWDRILGRSCVRQRYMALAVLDAFYNKRDVKNPEFKEYEDYLLRLGVLPVEEIEKSDKFIYKVAHSEPIAFEDIFGGAWQEKVFDEGLAQSYRETLDQLDKQYRCLLKLFDRNFKGYQ